MLGSTYKAFVLIAVTFKVVESLFRLEILELDNHFGEDIMDSFHEFVHELLLLGNGRTLLSKAQIEGILQVFLVVGATI